MGSYRETLYTLVVQGPEDLFSNNCLYYLWEFQYVVISAQPNPIPSSNYLGPNSRSLRWMSRYAKASRFLLSV